MTIRRLNLGEGMLYKEARLASLKESPEAFSSSYIDAINRSEKSWHEQADSSATGIDRATFIVIDDAPVGLAAIYRDQNESDVGELIQMWIAPEKRNGSSARNLLGSIFHWAASNRFSRIKAEVMSKNHRALKFYKKCGFIESSDSAIHSQLSVMLTKPVEQESTPSNHYPL
ncbi:MAG: GNAT family N-acetyltransferase [Akkermansiaceae bacterium]